jgi:hypothetical protein
MTLVLGQELALHFGSTRFNELGPCHNIHFSIKKNHATKSVRPLGVKGLRPIWAFGLITTEDFKPLTQQISMAFRCKAALSYVTPHGNIDETALKWLLVPNKPGPSRIWNTWLASTSSWLATRSMTLCAVDTWPWTLWTDTLVTPALQKV